MFNALPSLFVLSWAFIAVNSQNDLISPCPQVFDYENIDYYNNTWVGVISLSTDHDLTGILVEIKLDSPARALGVSTSLSGGGTYRLPILLYIFTELFGRYHHHKQH